MSENFKIKDQQGYELVVYFYDDGRAILEVEAPGIDGQIAAIILRAEDLSSLATALLNHKSGRSLTYPRKMSGTDMGGRYRIYDWVDGEWRGSGTLGPFDSKQGALDGIDAESNRHPEDTFCVVDRMGNIVYLAGGIK